MTFDPQAATAAYVDSLGAEALAKAEAYTTGNHWLLLGSPGVTGLFTWLVVRWGILERMSSRLQRRGTNLCVFLVSLACLLLLAAPVLIEPVFNEFKPVPEGEVRDALVQMAQSAGVPADRIFVYDGSRESNNFTASVSGLGGSARIAISDVAFKGASLDEVKAVTGHEIGHYVPGHVWNSVAVLSLLAVLFFSHPSVERRVRMTMEWKAGQPQD